MVIGAFIPELSFFPDGWWLHGREIAAGVVLAFFGYSWSDSDQGYDYLHHRNWFTHSCLMPVILTIATFFWIPVGFLSLTVGTHLLCDLKRDKLQGYGLISLGEGRRLRSRESKLWLLVNGLTCIACSYVIFWVV